MGSERVNRESEIRARLDALQTSVSVRVPPRTGWPEFVAHAPDDLAFLLAEVVRLRTALREAERFCARSGACGATIRDALCNES